MTERQKALRRVAKTQTAYWDALGEFERLVGVEFNSTAGFTYFAAASDKDVDDLIEHHTELR